MVLALWAAKWGVVGVTKTWAMELGEFGIRVNAILPGIILTVARAPERNCAIRNEAPPREPHGDLLHL